MNFMVVTWSRNVPCCVNPIKKGAPAAYLQRAAVAAIATPGTVTLPTAAE